MEKPPVSPEPRPNSARQTDAIPQGVELLLKVASLDPTFRDHLLRSRAYAAEVVGVRLTEAEVAMLGAVSRAQLKAIIAQTVVPEEQRRAFLQDPATALSRMGVVRPQVVFSETRGIAPDRPPGEEVKTTSQARSFAGVLEVMPMNFQGTKGIRPDRPPAEEHAADTPPGSPGTDASASQPVGAVPQHIELLLKIASIAPEFRDRLLQLRAGAAEAIGLRLTDAEAATLRAAPRVQLEAIIAQTVVPEEQRGAFLRDVKAALLGMEAALASRPTFEQTRGIAPDRPVRRRVAPESDDGGFLPFA